MRTFPCHRLPAALLSITLSVLLCRALPAQEASSMEEEVPARVPDTGQIYCYDTYKKIPCPEPGEPFYGQDGNFFINVPEYEVEKNNNGEIIYDKITGLRWQRTPDPNPRTWHDGNNYADTLELAGLSDWRMPAKHELQSILSYGAKPSPLVLPPEKNQPDTPLPAKRSAWTITTRLFPSLTAKAIDLDDNQGTISDKYEKKFVYAVQGPELVYGLFRNNGNGTITDTQTGLTWQTIEERPMNWENALRYCEQLELGGFTDWRLPTIKELSSLVDEKRIRPAIATDFFPATRSRPYWTGTTFAEHPGFAWYIDFADGLEHNGGYKGRQYYVRAVRGGLIAQALPEPATPKPALLLEPAPLKTRPLEPVAVPPETKPAPAAPVVKPVIPEAPELREPIDLLEPYPLDPEAQFE